MVQVVLVGPGPIPKLPDAGAAHGDGEPRGCPVGEHQRQAEQHGQRQEPASQPFGHDEGGDRGQAGNHHPGEHCERCVTGHRPTDDDPGAGGPDAEHPEEDRESVEQPAKVMRIGAMVKQLLDEVRNSNLDEKSRVRLRAIYEQSVRELAGSLSTALAD